MAALLCRARDLLCALPLECLVETMRPLPTTSYPHLPEFVLGVVRVRGTQMPVVDLGALLGSRLPARPARFLSLRLEGRGVILAVEGVVGLRQLEPGSRSNLPPLLSNANPDVVAGLGALDAELVLVLGTARLVPSEAWSDLEIGGPA